MSDCEIAQYYHTKERTARKEHGCCECTAKILVGEKYLEIRACWEGRPCVERQHLLCEKACEFVRDNGLHDDECLYFGELSEWYHEWVKSGYCHDSEIEERRTMWGFMLRIRRRELKARRLAAV